MSAMIDDADVHPPTSRCGVAQPTAILLLPCALHGSTMLESKAMGTVA